MTLDVVEWGDQGDRVVLVHGDVFDGPSTFEAQRSLALDHRLTVVNRRGFGANPDIDGEDFEVDASDICALLDREPAHLVGHSYGGVVSLLIDAVCDVLQERLPARRAVHPAPGTASRASEAR